MTYQPITPNQKNEWVEFLQERVTHLEGLVEDKEESRLLNTPDGDVATAKDLVGNLLALLTNKPVTIQ